MSRSMWAAAGASVFVIALTPSAALAAGGAGPSVRSAGAHAKQHRHLGRLSAARVGSRHHAAALLALGSGYQSRRGSDRVRTLQRELAHLSDKPGPIDGFFGPRTTRAVTRFQAAEGLHADGVVGPRTLTQLRVVVFRGRHLGAARSPRPVHARRGTPRPLPLGAKDRVPTTAPRNSAPRSTAAPSLAIGPGLAFWLLFIGPPAVILLMGAAVRRRFLGQPRRRRHIGPRMLVVARLAGFRYCPTRRAYVLRLVGNLVGPVLTTAPRLANTTPRPGSPAPPVAPAEAVRSVSAARLNHRASAVRSRSATPAGDPTTPRAGASRSRSKAGS